MDAARTFINQWYPAAGRIIADIIEEHSRRGVKTRRNWWDALAGLDEGEAVTVAGRKFPVLQCAQRRQGKPITPNAIPPSRDEPEPPGFRPGKWAAVKPKRAAKGTKAKTSRRKKKSS
jgi:hypothetical protein